MEQRDDGFFVKGGMHCPRCWRLNAPSATVCRECGADMVPAPEPVAVKVAKKEVDLTWLRGYAVACWIVMAVLIVIGLIMFAIYGASGSWADALMALVCATALAVIHLQVGKGLWLMQSWARTTAFQMHALMMIWGLASVAFSVSGLNIRYVDRVLTLPVMLALIGGLSVWVGARAEEGERLAVNGPDPDALAEIAAAPAKVVNAPANLNENAALLNMSPYPQRANLPAATPEAPVTSIYRANLDRNLGLEPIVEDEKKQKQEKMKRTAMMVGATAVLNFLQNRRERARDAEYYEDEINTSGRGTSSKRRAKPKSAAQQRRGGGIMNIIKMFLDQ